MWQYTLLLLLLLSAYKIWFCNSIHETKSSLYSSSSRTAGFRVQPGTSCPH
jgi:hypothetical protein